MTEITLKYSHTERYWDVYIIYFKGVFLTSIDIEKDKIIPFISKHGLCNTVGCIKILTKDTIYKDFNEDESYKKIIKRYEKDKEVKK